MDRTQMKLQLADLGFCAVQIVPFSGPRTASDWRRASQVRLARRQHRTCRRGHGHWTMVVGSAHAVQGRVVLFGSLPHLKWRAHEMMRPHLPTGWDWRDINYLTESRHHQYIPSYCGACWSFGTLYSLKNPHYDHPQGQRLPGGHPRAACSSTAAAAAAPAMAATWAASSTTCRRAASSSRHARTTRPRTTVTSARPSACTRPASPARTRRVDHPRRLRLSHSGGNTAAVCAAMGSSDKLKAEIMAYGPIAGGNTRNRHARGVREDTNAVDTYPGSPSFLTPSWSFLPRVLYLPHRQ